MSHGFLDKQPGVFGGLGFGLRLPEALCFRPGPVLGFWEHLFYYMF